MKRHSVTIIVDGREIRDWESYEVRLSVIEPANTAALSSVFERKRAEALVPGAPVTLMIDGRSVFCGYITSRERHGHRLTLQCHDPMWLMVQNSAPLRRLTKDSIRSVAEVLVDGVFARVQFLNAENRALFGRGGRRVSAEPPVFDRPDDPPKIPAGMSRWTALAEVLRRADLLAWGSGDGRSLILAKPNYAQEPRFDLRISTSTSRPSTCGDISISESIENRSRTVTVIAAALPPRDWQGRFMPSPKGRRRPPKGLTGFAEDPSFPLDIHQLIVEEPRTVSEADLLAQAYLDDAKAESRVVTVEAWQHGQGRSLYAPDTLADVADGRNGFLERLYVRAVTYSGSRDDERSTLECVPLNTRMVIQ